MVAKTAKKTTAAESGELTHLRVRATHDGYRRGPRSWSREPVVVARADFAEEELALLLADAHLRIEAVPAPAADASTDVDA